jgi:hypothetical protein
MKQKRVRQINTKGNLRSFSFAKPTAFGMNASDPTITSNNACCLIGQELQQDEIITLIYPSPLAVDVASQPDFLRPLNIGGNHWCKHEKEDNQLDC